MKKKAWRVFRDVRERFKNLVAELNGAVPDLGALEQRLIESRSGPAYTVETPAVYNEALDGADSSGEIKLILVADNPGRREQAAENRRYLVGPSGKIAERFFREHLGLDFRKDVVILNKTPIHTPRTAELKELCRLGGADLSRALEASERCMAELLYDLHRALAPVPVWIIGYSEMKPGGVFAAYTDTLRGLYREGTFREELFFYQHFSMNRFTIDLEAKRREGEGTAEALRRIGAAYRERVLGQA